MCLHPRLQPLIFDQGSLAINIIQGIRFNMLEGWGVVCHVERSLPFSINGF